MNISENSFEYKKLQIPLNLLFFNQIGDIWSFHCCAK